VVTRYDGAADQMSPQKPKTVGETIAEFAKTFKARAKAGQKKQSTAQGYGSHLRVIARWLGEQTPVTSINDNTFIRFNAWLLDEMGDKKKGDWYSRTLTSLFRRYVGWLAINGHITVPAILLMKTRELAISIKPRKIKTYKVEELADLFSVADDRMKTFLLLMLNCGFYQSDIAALKPPEVDWKRGTVTRKRTKEEDEENAPEVCWKLWPETLEGMKRNRSECKDLVFLNERGNPLRTWNTSSEGRESNNDNIRNAFERLQNKLGIKRTDPRRKTLKHIRKTAASLLGTRKDYKPYAQYFLGQAPDNVADSSYVVPDQATFDECVMWLREKFLPAITATKAD